MGLTRCYKTAVFMASGISITQFFGYPKYSRIILDITKCCQIYDLVIFDI